MVRPFIDDYIKSLNTSSKVRAAYILQAARADKNEVQRIANRLSQDVVLAGLSISDDKPSSIINSTKVKRAFRDAENIFKSTYDISNEVSLLLDSHASILSADVKALEDELIVLEKAVDNYAFLLSDAKAFNYAYMEAFNDNRGREFFSFFIPDRAGLKFNTLEEATVDPLEGVLSIGRTARQAYPLIASVLRSNARQYIVSDTQIKNAVSPSTTEGWKMSVASPSIITSDIGLNEFSGYVRGGLQVLAEFTLTQAAPVDTISIRPMANSGLEILQIRVYLDEDEVNWFDLLDNEDDPTPVDSVKRFSFNLQPIFKFKVLFRKVDYTRGKPKPSGSEHHYREIYLESTSKPNRTEYLERNNNRSTAQRDVFFFDNLFDPLVKSNSVFKVNLPRYEPSRSGALAKSRASLEKRTQIDPRSTWSNDSIARQTIFSIIDSIPLGSTIQQMSQTSHGTLKPGSPNSKLPSYGIQHLPRMAPQRPGTDVQPPRQSYDYNIGLMNVTAFSSENSYRSVFVSKQIPSRGDIGAVRIKSSETNFMQSALQDYDNAQLTSVEYSVSNVASPQEETDWHAILPIGQTEVSSERLYPDDTGKALFRLPALLAAPLAVYKNGMLFVDFTTVSQDEGQTLIGIQMNVGTYSSDDILTVAYTPKGDPTIVDFRGEKFSIPPLVSASDDDGAGQGFSATGGQVAIQLQKPVFIDYSQVETSTYNTTFGLTPYAPLVIRLEDGTLAYNLTNYKREAQSTLDPSVDYYQYLHSGDSIIFNKPVTESFRVFYQYLPENLRVRTILRVDHKDWVTPKVDYFQVKAKVRSQDPKAA